MQESIKKSAAEGVKEDTAQAAEVATDVKGKVDEVQGASQQGTPITASYSGNIYYMKPCPLSKIPELVGYIKTLEELMNKELAPTEILTMEDGKVLKQMGEVIKLGIIRDNPSKSVESVMDEFSLGDFPKVYKTALDINDFLAGMSSIYQTKKQGK